MADSRREFLKKSLLGAGGVAAGLLSTGCPKNSTAAGGASQASAATQLAGVQATGVLAKVTGGTPYDATRLAVSKLGGISKFVNKGQTVGLLPNVGWARSMEQAANTHPEVVRALIELCYEADCKSVTVFCNPCNNIKACLDESGVGQVVEASKASFDFISDRGWRERKKVAGVSFLNGTEVYRVVDDCDVLINAPVAKHHGGAQLTMCCKNLMGAIKDRRKCHQNLHEAIADLTLMIPHQLCVLDASRILTAHGPSGGNLDDVSWKHTIIAGANPVEVDVLGCELFGTEASQIGYLKLLGERGYAPVSSSDLKFETAKA